MYYDFPFVQNKKNANMLVYAWKTLNLTLAASEQIYLHCIHPFTLFELACFQCVQF